MTRYTMSQEKAHTILREVAVARSRWGKQASPPYTMLQIMEAVERVVGAGALEPPSVTEDDVIKLRRQLGASKSRETKLLKRLKAAGVTVGEIVEDDHNADSADA